MSSIPIIPPGIEPGDLVATINDRIRRINNALASLATPVASAAAAPANSVQIAYATGSLTLTTSAADIPGATLTLTKSGIYLIVGVVDFSEVGAGDVPSVFSAYGNFAGTLQVAAADFAAVTANARATVAQQWLYAGTPGNIVKLQAKKSGGTGSSLAATTNTSISALYVAAS